MKKSINPILGIALLFAIGFFVLSQFNFGTNNSVTKKLKTKPENQELISYETEADSADECSSYETYDPRAKVCFYECENELQCTEIQKKIDDELNSWSEQAQQDKTQISEKKSDEDNMLATYTVSVGEKINLATGEDRNEYRKIWDDVAALSPDNISDKYISSFEIYNDPKSDTLAFVNKEETDKWRVVVNAGIYNDQTVREKKMTLIHELGHIISLNDSQLKADAKNCPGLTIDEGCPNMDSPLEKFWERFWKGIKKPKYDENKYVSEYATTNEIEDWAETFAHFVVDKERDSLGNDIRDQKIKLLYSFGELVSIRTDMRNVISRDIVRAIKLAR